MPNKVLFISSWYPNPQDKTHGIFVKRYAEAIALFNNVAVIHVFGDEHFTDEVKIESRTENNVYEVYVYFKKKNSNSISKLLNYRKRYLLGLDHLLKTWGKPDLVQVNVVFPVGIAGLAIAEKLNIPLVVSEHWTGYHPEDRNYSGMFKKFFTKKIIRRAKAIITVTDHLKQSMLHHGLKGDYSVIPNVVNTNIFKYSPKSKLGKFRFLHVSSLESRQKNVEAIIDTFKKLHQQNNSTELIIVGDGDNRKELENRCGNLLNSAIYFPGQKFGLEMADEFNKADCFVLFSNFENLPVVLLEAICCGMPVISTDVGGIKEFVKAEQGNLIPAGNNIALLNSMQNMANQLSKFDRVKISKYGEDNFSYEKIGRLFTDVYNKALKK